jgi:hypothetical protein
MEYLMASILNVVTTRRQQCPVKLSHAGCKSNIKASFKRFMGVHDLNFRGGFKSEVQQRSVSIFENPLISCALQPDTTRTIAIQQSNQMILFDF